MRKIFPWGPVRSRVDVSVQGGPDSGRIGGIRRPMRSNPPVGKCPAGLEITSQ